LTPVILTNVVAAQGRAATPYIWALATIWGVDLLLLGGVAAGRLRWLLRSNFFLAGEIGVAVILNLWMSAAMPHGTFAAGGRDTFWWYSISTVALWTGLRGARTGAAMVVGAALLQLGMVWINGSAMDFGGWMQFLFRYAWMFLAYGLAVLVMRLARQGTRLAVAAGLRAGAAAQRADMLRAMHDTVLQTLEALALRIGAVDAGAPAEARLREAGQVAQAQADELRTLLREDTAAGQRSLDSRLHALRQELGRRGLQVELTITGGLDRDPPAQTLEAVEGAVREALSNVVKHAGVARATVKVALKDDALEVWVRDHGRGFDPATASHGYGLTGSIRARMAEAGGTSEVWSVPGKGTHIRLQVDTTPNPARRTLASRWVRPLTTRLARWRVPALGAVPTQRGLDALTAEAFGWFAVAVLAYRVAVVPIAAVNSLANVPEILLATLTLLLGPLLIGNIALLVGVVNGRLRGLLESNAFLVADVAIAVAVNLWASLLIEPGSFNRSGRDALMPYALAVIVLWTTLRGARTGLVLLVGAGLLELAMGIVNGVALAEVDWWMFLGRFATASLAVLLPLVVIRFARQGGREQAAAALRAGRETERARLLRDIHEQTLGTLDRIVALTTTRDLLAAERLREARRLTVGQVADLRAVLQVDGEEPSGELAAGLRRLAARSRSDGLAVELVTQLNGQLPAAVSMAILEAAEQALADAAGRAGTRRVVVRAVARPEGVEITVRDHGAVDAADGIEGPGGREMGKELQMIGGRVEVWAAPGRGTKVTLWAPE
jgi:signal transduction histidine kinase